MHITRRTLIAAAAALPMAGRASAALAARVGRIDRLDPGLDAIVDADAPIEVLGTGYRWAEGPVWVPSGGYLLFTDVPGNVIWQWRPGGGAPVRFLDPSGPSPIPAGVREAGANGLTLDRQGRLLMAGSGSRSIERMDLATRERTVLASRFDGRPFNSPNDLVEASDGSIYFTDPPYGLADGDGSPMKAHQFNGVFRLDPDGQVTLVEGRLFRPNGIALSPDERIVYVTQSDGTSPSLFAYDRLPDGSIANRRAVLTGLRERIAAGEPGLPDGLKVASDGTLFVTGPGGVLVVTPGGEHLGTIRTGKPIANCTLAPDGWLYLTSQDMLARVRTRARPAR
ncbi:SMP-30/gluconolactonase/LRE family protein [Sphingomonas sp. CJ99]